MVAKERRLQRRCCSRVCCQAIQLYGNSRFFSPWVGGISGGPKGAHSVALSGGYDDDVDLGYALYAFPFP